MLDGVHVRGRAFVFRQELSKQPKGLKIFLKKEKGSTAHLRCFNSSCQDFALIDLYNKVLLPVVDGLNGLSHLFKT